VARKDKTPPAKPGPDDSPMSREQEAFFQEVEEEMKQDRYAALWKKYGRYVVAFFVACVLGVAGYQWWQARERQARFAESERFAAALALAKEGKAKEANEALAALGAASSKGYGALARLQHASALAKAGDRAGAIKVLDALAADGKADKVFRDYATINLAYLALDDGDPAAMLDRLKPLLADGSPWRFIGAELSAYYLERAGKRAEAVELLSRLAKDPEAPAGGRARAREMLALLGKS
jgi:hypothetical protein